MDTTTGSPRAAVIAFLGLCAAVLAAAIAVALAATPASATGLTPFADCPALEAWAGRAMGATPVGGKVVAAPVPATTAADAADAADAVGAAESGAGATGGTNTAVVGVDELDVVDRIDDHRVLAVGPAGISVLDTASARVADHVAAPAGSQVTYDPEARVAWVVGPRADGVGVEVRRLAVDGDRLQADGTWSAGGSLVDARRIDDQLVVVATDGMGAKPFGGGPVPCDEVLHPAAPTEASATLLVVLPVDGDLEPQHATEVVGTGSVVHVTDDAAYLATPQWQGNEASTGIHRFSLPELAHTASTTVSGSLLGDLAMSDDGHGHLRVATTRQPMVMVDVAAPLPGATVTPDVTVSPDATVSSDDGTPAGGTASTEAPAPEPATNRIVVLDAAGDLHQVGATAPFGHPGETLQGVRFAGDVAYAVTFLQTDPFIVVDLSDPAAPKVAGELELPGFSSYLHPLGDGLVLGFGPDGHGAPEAKLFDAAEPTNPRLVGTVPLGGDAPVAYDRHAIADLGDGRVAIPVARYGTAKVVPCPMPAPGVDVACGAEGPTEPTSEVLVLSASRDGLREVARHPVELRAPAQRVLHGPDGWVVASTDQAAVVVEGGAVRATLDLA